MYKNLEACLDLCIEQGRDDFEILSAKGLSGDEILMIACKGFAIAKVTDHSDEGYWYKYEYRLIRNSRL